MDERLRTIFALDDDCTRLCLELRDCLVQEKIALIQLNIDAINQTNLTKENLIQTLSKRKRLLVDQMLRHYGVRKRTELELNASDQEEWIERCRRWDEAWKATRNIAEANQGFLEHSLKNLGLMVDNLKRLFGDNATYTNRGLKTTAPNSGKVVEARY